MNLDGNPRSLPRLSSRLRGQRLGVSLLGLLLLSTTACVVVVVQGPTTLQVGDTATYVLHLSDGGTTNATAWVGAQVPDTWTLVSASYTATLGGLPDSGSGTVGSEPGLCGLSPPPAGFQRIWISAGPFAGLGLSDDGTATLQFAVNDLPSSTFDIAFWLAAVGGLSDCSDPEFLAINAPSTTWLQTAQTIQKAPTGETPSLVREIAVSPDLAHVYTMNLGESRLISYSRSALDGSLSYIGFTSLATAPSSLLVTPDGTNLYVARPVDATAGAVDVFTRTPGTGLLTLSQTIDSTDPELSGLKGASDLAISQDGTSLYVTGANALSLVALSREPISGSLTHLQTLMEGVGGVSGLFDPVALIPDPTDANLYVCSTDGNSVAAFARNGATGTISFLQKHTDGSGGVEGISECRGIAIDPSGLFLYAAGVDGLATFSRDPSSGELTFVGRLLGAEGAVGVSGIASLAVDPKVALLYAASFSHDSLAVFELDPTTGLPSLQSIHQKVDDNPAGVGSAWRVRPLQNGTGVFLGAFTAQDGETVLSYLESPLVFADGFESGTTDSWTLATP